MYIQYMFKAYAAFIGNIIDYIFVNHSLPEIK